ncbi:MAG: helix-turn-helix transcriptional regulator [Marinisporobacter sp.]|jgi:putative transcriptional regulator|nr:helix-turn-helix transcriptional regulator [Marinisporobacter sp.]
MGIIVNLDVMMAKRKISLTELAERVGITNANLSILKNNKAKAVRFTTLEAICRELNCQPGDLLEYASDEDYRKTIIKSMEMIEKKEK